MKMPVILLWICLLSTNLQAAENDGIINQLTSGSYEISYPDQIISIHFSFVPSNGLDNLFQQGDLSEDEKYRIVQILKEQLDQLPGSFINKYLDIDIFPLHVINALEFGYTFDQQLVVDVDKIKEGMSYARSIKSALVHEIGHLVEENPETKAASSALRNYFSAIQRTYDGQEQVGTGIYDRGYVSRYASGELLDRYNPSEEFAELFAHLICRESRWEIEEYLEENSESILSIKIDRFLNFLDNHLAELGREYLFGKPIQNREPTQIVDELGGELLLEAHELKSYESFDFTSVEVEDELFTSSRIIEPNEPPAGRTEWEKAMDEFEHSVYQYSESTEEFSQRESEQKQKTQKQKRRKRRGLIIAGVALYIAMQMMK